MNRQDVSPCHGVPCNDCLVTFLLGTLFFVVRFTTIDSYNDPQLQSMCLAGTSHKSLCTNI